MSCPSSFLSFRKLWCVIALASLACSLCTSLAAQATISSSEPYPFAGDTVTLTVTPTAGFTVSAAAFYFNNVEVQSGASLTYTIPNIGLSQGGTYTVLITFSSAQESGSESLFCSLQVSDPTLNLSVAQPPKTPVGGNVMLSVIATGEGPFTWVWYKTGSSTSLATTSSGNFELTNLLLSSAGTYYAVVSSSTTGDSATSALLNLVVGNPPVISPLPATVAVVQNASTSVTATVTGGIPLTYSWSNGTQVVGGNSPTLTLSDVQPSAQGNYELTVTNADGSAHADFFLEVDLLPQFNRLPAPTIVLIGGDTYFDAGVSEDDMVTWQWYKDGGLVATDTAQNTDSYHVNGATSGAAGQYWVVVTNAYGSVTSNKVTLTVAPPPIITIQPVGQALAVGGTIQLSVTSTAVGTPTYQWYSVAQGAIPNTNSTTFTKTNAQPGDATGYWVVIETTYDGNLISSTAQVTVSGTGSGPTPTPTPTPSPTATLTPTPSPTSAATPTPTPTPTARPTTTPTPTSAPNAQPSSGPTPTPISSSSGTSELISMQPVGATVVPGTAVTFTTGSSSATATYQWFHGSAAIEGSSLAGTAPPALSARAISGAHSSTLVIYGATAADNGTYQCLVTTAAGSALSEPATLSVTAAANPGRLINLSCRAAVGTGSGALIAGFVLGGSATVGNVPLLVRASGPALAAFGVPGLLPDPTLALYTAGSELIASNVSWGGNATIIAIASAVGSFPWVDDNSHDAALAETLAPGAYTAEVAGAAADTGVALAEVYDTTPLAAYELTSSRLINVSARIQVGTGGNILIAGFVIGGTTSKTVLIRASGPALIPFGLSGTLPDPKLQVYNAVNAVVAANVGWQADSQIAAVAARVGAFKWPGASPDSALLITLPPGAYTAQVSGAQGDAGVALVEVYDVQ